LLQEQLNGGNLIKTKTKHNQFWRKEHLHKLKYNQFWRTEHQHKLKYNQFWRTEDQNN
jgi:hypothetical protein